ncbi:MAG: hypothetical protein H6748_10340 [Spirochaetaceae bacterium]|nr:hypothetical protein [Myxococcales bacterium]MCB9724430.1 hypothetical protein [Spirochaetaceae bacterium]HPG24303.1 hypothetical protein [Myxococcota bacterium]
MIGALRARRWIGALAIAFLGCAASGEPERPLPAHPFPGWVRQLETGRTRMDEVEARFGRPDEIESGVRGGTIWRYAFREVHWPADDPARPIVASDGRLARPAPGPLDRAGRGLRRVGDWLDWLLFYPPRQPRPPRSRALPATVHDLELRFGIDGALAELQYRPHPGRAWVPAPR